MIKQEINGSRVEIEEKELRIIIPQKIWTKKGWEKLIIVIGSLLASGLNWIVKPSE
ncbi:MAG: hypothetical protein AAF335_05060 [Bacteroidota bacterium]